MLLPRESQYGCTPSSPSDIDQGIAIVPHGLHGSEFRWGRLEPKSRLMADHPGLMFPASYRNHLRALRKYHSDEGVPDNEDAFHMSITFFSYEEKRFNFLGLIGPEEDS